MALFGKMCVLFALMLIGLFLGKKGYLSEETNRQISFLVIHVANPALIVKSAIEGDKSIRAGDLFVMFGIGVIIAAVLILLACVFVRVTKCPDRDESVYRLMTVFSNTGFMGYPLVEAVFGVEYILRVALFNIVFDVLAYTYGIRILSEKGRRLHLRDLGRCLNTGLAASACAVVISLTRADVPAAVHDFVGYLSGLAAPLSMIVIGVSASSVALKELKEDYRLYLFTGFKLLVIPVIVLAGMRAATGEATLIGTVVILMATPAATMNVMFAKQYGGNDKLAVKGVMLTTLFAVVTLPLMSLLIQAVVP